MPLIQKYYAYHNRKARNDPKKAEDRYNDHNRILQRLMLQKGYQNVKLSL